jgi:hypothetical protein
MNITWQPVNPARLAEHVDGQLSSVKQGTLRPVRLHAAPTYTGVSVSVFQLTVEALAELDFREIAHVHLKGNTFFYLLEVAAYTGTTVEIDDANPSESIILMKREGIGFRIGVVAWKIDAHLTGSLTSVAASVKIKNTLTAMRVKTYGFGIEAIDAIKELAAYKDGFTPHALTLIGNSNEMVTDYVLANKDALKPTVLGTAVIRLPRYDLQKGARNLAVSWHSALESIYRKQPLETAARSILANRKYAPQAVLPMMVATYNELGVSSSLDIPSDEAKTEASRILQLGRS